MAKLTDEQEAELRWLLPAGDDWRTVGIDRSGRRLARAAVRQGLRRRGLVESHPEFRRWWRLTPKGRAALAELEAPDA